MSTPDINCPKLDVFYMFKWLDVFYICSGNQNGMLEFEEFRDLMLKNNFYHNFGNLEEEEKEILEAFRYMDKDNSGTISAHNLMVVWNTYIQ